jgi:hypothetical protein
MANAPTARMTWSFLELNPAAPPNRGSVLMLAICSEPGTLESCWGVWPMTTISEFGEGSAEGPIVPICVPSKRSASSAAGLERRSRVRAGDA